MIYTPFMVGNGLGLFHKFASFLQVYTQNLIGMKKLYTTFGLFLAFALSAGAVNANFSWFLGGGGASGSDYAADVATDGDGNIFFMGSFANTSTFNGITVTGSAKGSGSSYDKSLLIEKMSPTKAHLWNILSNDGVFNPVAMATTKDGSLIVTGSIRAVKNTAAQTTTANIVDAAGTITSFSNLGSDATFVQTVVARFNSSGVIQWVKEINSSATKEMSVEPSALVVDGSGNIYLTGIFAKTAVFPASTPISVTSTNTTQAAFYAKLDGTTGNALWVRTTSGGIITENFNGLALGPDGVYVAGSAKNVTTPVAVNVGPTFSYTPSITPSLFLVKTDFDGMPIYLQSRAALSTDATKGDLRVKDVVVKDGKVIVAGSFQGSYGGIQFASGAMTATATYLNGFLAAFNANDGSDAWQKAITSPGITEINSLANGVDGKVWAHGYTYNGIASVTPGDCAFGNGVVLTDANNKLGDLFLTSFNPADGAAVEAHWAGKGNTTETANALTAFGGNLYLASTTNSNPITFENATMTYARLGNFDFVLQNYTVATALNSVQTNSVSSYFDQASRSIVVKNANEFASVALFDLTGRKVGSMTVSANEVRFSNVPQGIYVLGATKLDGNLVSVKIGVQY